MGPLYPLLRDQVASLFQPYSVSLFLTIQQFYYYFIVISVQGLDSLKDFCLPNVY